MYHVWGNHELYNYTKRELAESQLNSSRDHQETDTDIDATSNGPSDSPHSNYYHFSPMSGFRVAVIDTYDVGALGYEATSTDPRLAEATRILAERNPNTDKNSPLGMQGLDTRFVKYNGGVGQKQLQWLRRVLREANTAREKVLIAGHIPIYVESASPANICWNYGEVLDVIHDFPECIVAYISGHDHDGGRAIDDYGIQHVTIEAVIETPPGVSAFATVHVHRDRVVVDGGGGRVTTTVMYLSS
ncbi:hypothetical protein NP493_331g01028 [Ridgeia piscesae]|uniref:Calcineurin-like phosphoesterase domain-containing protein n=1 Tax=Ridgeia piscesae TaxID=27915 RepID=A0AAD9NU46_RIDPI|nr:hypothetical protein NP493_331g01028 [Ridgeia piscesae]